MDADGLASVQEDQELAATPDEIARIAAAEALVDVHTCLPGIVKSFDPATQTAKVQPAIMRLWRDGGWKPLPPCVDCPVQFLRYGNIVITGPVSAGDEGALHFSERSIDNWWARGGVQEQSEMRMHDLSDGFFAPGYSSKGRVPGNIATDALEIRTLDGATMFRLEKDFAIMGTPTGAQKALMAEAFRTAQKTLNTSASAAFKALAAASSSGPLVALQPQFTAIQGLFDAFETAAAGALNFLAQKSKVG